MRPYRADDIAQINLWRKARGLPPVGVGHLPQIGHLVPGVAAGFLYRTDSNVAFIEGLVSNPEAPKEARQKALDAITTELAKDAKGLGYAVLLGMVSSKNVAARSVAHGFKAVGAYLVIQKDL